MTMRHLGRTAVLAGLLVVRGAAIAGAQGQITLLWPPSGVGFAPDSAEYFYSCPPGGAVPPTPCVPAFVPGGPEFWWLCGVTLQSPAGCGSATSTEDGYVHVTGSGSNTLGIRALNLAYDDYDCCTCPGGPYKVKSEQTITAFMLVRVDVIGQPAGAPVTVSYRWNVYSAAWDDGPVLGGGGNAAQSTGAASLAGAPLVGNNFDVVNDRGIRRGEGVGSVGTTNGSTIPIFITQHVLADCEPPAAPPCQIGHQEGPEHDTASARRDTQLTLTVRPDGAPGDPPPDGCPAPTLEFSVDIGGDTEMSDPTPDGNEVFDPADSYLSGGPALPPGGADGVRSDDLVYGVDWPPMVPGGPGAPSCGGGAVGPLSTTYQDIDGMDSTDVALTTYIPAPVPLAAPVPEFASACIRRLDTLMISFDDDAPSHFAGAAGSCPVPVGSTAPSGATYGSGPARDELFSVSLFGAGPTYTAIMAPVASESAIHPSLAPDPPPDIPLIPTPQDTDDDVDAIDLTAPGCGFWLRSIDHEARAPFPAGGPQPGWIFSWSPGGGAVPLVMPVQLGLPATVDIRDFEFVFSEFPAGSGLYVLTLLFAVAPDDPLTPAVDESGGLDARMIYRSYLTGTNAPLLDEPLPGPVDGIANWCEALVLSAPPATPTCACAGDLTGDLQIDGEDVQRFVGCLTAYDPATCQCGEINGVPPQDAADIPAFVARLLSPVGCGP